MIVIATMVSLTVASVVIGYRDTYSTATARLRFAAAFQNDLALRLFYGVPRDLASVGGYAEFRLVGLLSVLAGGWAVVAAVRAFRTEEESGRWELMLSGSVSRRAATAWVLGAMLAEWGLVWLALTATLLMVGKIPGNLTAIQAVTLAFAVLAPALMFGPISALACQFLGTARGAQAFGGAALTLALLLRIAADTAGVSWVRWLTPLGWAEELHPVTGARPAVFGLFVASAAAIAVGTVVVAAHRDVGLGLWAGRRSRASHETLLGSSTQAAIRDDLPTLAVWIGAAGIFAALIGAFSKNIADDARRSGLDRRIEAHLNTASGYLSLSFVVFTLVVALFAASHVVGMRGEESSGRLETVFALPVGRVSWLGGRVALAVVTSAALGVAIGVSAWVGAASQHAGVGLVGLVAAGLNTVPVALLFLGIGTTLFAFAPRHAGGVTLTLVGVSFLWELVGGVLGAPIWLLKVSPFEHVAAVPQSAFNIEGAIGMIVVGAVTLGVGVVGFVRRDLAIG